MNWLDDLLDMIAAMDVFDQLDRLIGGLAHFHRRALKRGGVHHAQAIAQTLLFANGRVLQIKRSAIWSGKEVEDLLKRYHIAIWGRWFSKLELEFAVPKWQARWAEYIMRRAGVPVTSVVDPHNSRWAAQYTQAPKPWGRR